MTSRIEIPGISAMALAAPQPKTWEGEQKLDREGRPLSTVRILAGAEVADVTVPTGAIGPELADGELTPIRLVRVAIGATKAGRLWLAADAVEAQ